MTFKLYSLLREGNTDSICYGRFELNICAVGPGGLPDAIFISIFGEGENGLLSGVCEPAHRRNGGFHAFH